MTFCCPKCGEALWCSRREVMGFDEWGADERPVESEVHLFCKGHPQHVIMDGFRDMETAVRYFRRCYGGATRARRHREVTTPRTG